MPACAGAGRPAWKKPTKYHAVKTLVGDVLCDSMAEARRWRVLQAMEATGLITRLRPHPAFPLVVNGQKIGVYIADAEYSTRDGRRVVEDTKSQPTKTPVYNLKKRLMKALHNIEIHEVSA